MPEAERLAQEPRFKVWRTHVDDRTRETHLQANGQVRFTGEPFNVGDALLQEPRDPDGPPEETYNCRCHKEEYLLSGLPADLLPQVEGRLTPAQRQFLPGIRVADATGGGGNGQTQEDGKKPRPSYSVLTKQYEAGLNKGAYDFMTSLGGKVETNANLPIDKGRWTNSCTVRLSDALNSVSGQEIPYIPKQTVSNKDGNWYMYRVDTMEGYLKGAYGPPDGTFTNKSDFLSQFTGEKGIIVLKIPFSNATGHVSIWDGQKMLYGEPDYLDEAKKIMFWELPK